MVHILMWIYQSKTISMGILLYLEGYNNVERYFYHNENACLNILPNQLEKMGFSIEISCVAVKCHQKLEHFLI